MTLTRRRFNQILVGIATLPWLPSAFAELEEGQDWRAIAPPQPSDVPGKIEVLEFFSYGCPHCGALNPLAKEWAAKLPEDVAFRRVPVTFGRQAWANLARLYYSLEDMEQIAQLDQAVFAAIHDKRVKLFTEEAILDWLKDAKVDTTHFSEIYNSFDVQTQVGRGDYLAGRFAIDAVPTITVGGRYAVLGRKVQGLTDLLAIADQLIDKARAEGTTS
jgi:protein dithiol oxidoreductase (disulfide-forming)